MDNLELDNNAQWWIIACRCDTCLPTKGKRFNYLICVKTWLFENRKEFSRENTFWNSDLLHIRAGRRTYTLWFIDVLCSWAAWRRGNEGLVDELESISRYVYLSRVCEWSRGAKGKQMWQSGIGAYSEDHSQKCVWGWVVLR